ncbi:MAG: hypothetical protein ABIS38_03000 [Sphingomicrobium sp.]
MTYKMRAVLGIVLVELLLGGLWLYLAARGAERPSRVTADFQATLGSTIGAAMGALLGLGVLLLLIAAKRDRR